MLTETDEGLLLPVKVTPKSKVTCITGWENGFLKIKVAAPPEKGEANQAVIRLLSKILHIPQKNISLMKGRSSRIKLFLLKGITKINADQHLKF